MESIPSIKPYRDLSLDDISKIINNYRLRLKDLIKLYHQKKNGLDLKYTEAKDYTSTNMKILSKNLLDVLGFTQTSLYKKEAEILSEKLCEEFHWNRPHGNFSNEELSTCIIKEILDYYDVGYSEEELLMIYDISKSKFDVLYKKCSEWCKKNYWK